MSTQCLKSQKHKAIMHATLVVAGVFALLLSLLLSTTHPAFAASMRSHANQPNQPPEDITRSGVSVVRIVTSYGPKAVGNQIGSITGQCTGLGVIVASWDATKANEQNNWILTDGTLVDSTSPICMTAASIPGVALLSVEILPSHAYTSKTTPFPITLPANLHCQENQCNQGPALLSFATPVSNGSTSSAFPYADLATSNTRQEAQVELTQSATSLALPPFSVANNPTYSTTVKQYLTPNRVSTTLTKTDNGLPLINSVGELVGMHLMSETLTAEKISSFMSLEGLTDFATKHQNPVHDDWLQAMNDYYKTPQTTQDVQNAQKALQQAATANPQFDGASALAQTIGQPQGQAETAGNRTPTKTTSSSDGGILSSLSSLLKNPLKDVSPSVLVVAALVILLILAALIYWLFHRIRLNKVYNEAKKESDLLERKQKEQEQQQRRPTADKPTLIQAPLPLQLPYASRQDAPPEPPRQMSPLQSLNRPYSPPLVRAGAANNTAPSNQELHCPNCGFTVARGTITCPNCNMLLSPSESGLHLRVRLQPVTSVEDQPTNTIPMGVQSNSVYDADKTKPDLSREPFDPQKTQPNSANMRYDTNARVRAIGNYPPGFVVVPRTSRGIKRKHKANEDSVFAAQGARLVNGRLQQIGIFVVADGMGGHANGQDASRTAIQRIGEYIIPILEEGRELSLEDFKQLIMNGVREANRAVHRRNTEQHADMGTTMTAALVVDTPSIQTLPDGQQVSGPVTAFVVNVGDSRTYFYNDSTGLKKLTQDHSVVASLVAAGIIEEDDIYTHPKRNQIYRSLGEKMEVEVDSFIKPLQPNDKLLLCSDGLWDMVRDPKLELTIRNNMPDLEKVGDGLIQAALEGGGEDNVSIIFVHIPEDNKRVAETPGIHTLAIPGRDPQ